MRTKLLNNKLINASLFTCGHEPWAVTGIICLQMQAVVIRFTEMVGDYTIGSSQSRAIAPWFRKNLDETVSDYDASWIAPRWWYSDIPIGRRVRETQETLEREALRRYSRVFGLYDGGSQRENMNTFNAAAGEYILDKVKLTKPSNKFSINWNTVS